MRGKYMALARIISHSHQCARELALDLLARGYAVEIVSPDAIPDNFADLELRVESGPDNALTAAVGTRTGARSASLEFVHHLKAPMRDFMRRDPATIEPVPPPAASIPLNTDPVVTKQSIANDNVSEQIVHDRSLIADVPSVEVDTAAPISVSHELQELGRGSTQTLSAVTMIDVHEPKSGQNTKLETASFLRTWHWRSGVAFAALLLVAIALGFTVRHQNYFASASTSEASASQDFAMSSMSTNPPTSLEPNLPVVAKPAAVIPSASGTRTANHQQGRPSKSALSPRTAVTIAKRQRNDDVVAPNTVVYFDHRTAQSNPAKKVPRHAQRAATDGVIASTTTPDLSVKPAPKAAPQR
jgi:hypothetical protein